MISYDNSPRIVYRKLSSWHNFHHAQSTSIGYAGSPGSYSYIVCIRETTNKSKWVNLFIQARIASGVGCNAPQIRQKVPF